MFYIENIDKPNFIDRRFNRIRLSESTISVPIIEEQTNKKIKKIAQKTIKILGRNSNSNKLIVSKRVLDNEIYINYLNSYGYNILEGKILSNVIESDLIEYIFKKRKEQLEKFRFSILINDLTEREYKNIEIYAKKYKNVNIVTNHMEKFRMLEKKLREDVGVIITVTNNKRKSLAKANIILNIDFPEELINQYSIYEKALILSLNNKIKIKKKRFNGEIILNYEIDYRSDKKDLKALEGKYYLKDLYEATLYENLKFEELRKKIKNDRVIIKALYNNRGIWSK